MEEGSAKGAGGGGGDKCCGSGPDGAYHRTELIEDMEERLGWGSQTGDATSTLVGWGGCAVRERGRRGILARVENMEKTACKVGVFRQRAGKGLELTPASFPVGIDES